MQTNLQQKAQVLQALVSYAQKQLNTVSAITVANARALDCIAEKISNAANVLRIAQAFAATSDVDALCCEVLALDALVRNDLQDDMCKMHALSIRMGYTHWLRY